MWRVDLAAVGDEVLATLTMFERERASRILDRRAAARWARARGVLRTLLGRYVEARPETLQLAATVHGKLRLAGAWAEHGLHFNLSHSGELALCALTRRASVGVDVQGICEPNRRGQVDRTALAARVFGAEAAERVRAVPRELREREFVRLWTRHEAALKQRGLGLAAGRLRQAQAPWIAELDVGPRAAAAVACAQAPLDLRLWDWHEVRQRAA